jgi:ubiquinone/menaquinone biosynthesis C-methylase UbiE
MSDERRAVQEEFERVAEAFAERTQGRFDEMDVVAFSRVRPEATVLEVGAGTGNFLSLFSGVAGRLIASDLTRGMLEVARRRHDGIEVVAADGARLPFRSGSIELVATAQALHHIQEPLPVLSEMRRVVADEGRALVVDQVAPESYEQASSMNRLDVMRDPTHAATRPASAFRIMVSKAGLDIVDEQVWEGKARFSQWMWPGEFPEDRIAAVRDFIEEFGSETGMDWERDGEDWLYTRRRIMILARRAGSPPRSSWEDR